MPTRQPLTSLPLSAFRSHSPSPQKNPARSSPHKMSRLLPSPVLVRPAKTPLGTLFEAPPASPRVDSPRARLLAEDEADDGIDEAIVPTPPRRLLEAFLGSAKKAAVGGVDGWLGGSRSGTGSPAPGGPQVFGSPTKKSTKVEDEAAAFEFYEDSPPSGSPPVQRMDSTTPVDTEVESEEAEDPFKENTRPALKPLRSTSLLSQGQPTVVANPSTTPPLPSTTTLTTTAMNDIPFLTTPPSSSSTITSIFPAWTDDVPSASASAFSEGTTSMASLSSGSNLLPGFSLAFSPRKRSSGGEGGSEGKRTKCDWDD